MLKIAQAELRRVEEMTSSMPMSLFTTDAAGYCPMVFHSWLLIVDGRLVVVDPCAGNDRNFPHYPIFHMLRTPYIERFEATGFRPEEVDYVFCAHLHGDHCGWNTRLRGKRLVPTFPNARYLMVPAPYAGWVREQDGKTVFVPIDTGI